MSETLTGAAWHFSASHRKPDGQYHGHTWEVTAWWPAGECAVVLQSRLRAALVRFDEKQLPDELSRAEALARAIGEELAGCVEVELERRSERLFARWRV